MICRWDCFFRFKEKYITHQWILCNEWVPSEFKQLKQVIIMTTVHQLTSCEVKSWVRNKTIIRSFLTSNHCFRLKYVSSVHNSAWWKSESHLIWIRREICTYQALFPNSKQFNTQIYSRILMQEDNREYIFFTGGRIIKDYVLLFWPKAMV